MIPVQVALVRCRRCAFENRWDAAGCFMCGQSLAGAEPAVARERPGGVGSPAALVAREPPLRLTSVMLAVASIAVFFGVLQMAPGLALVLAIPITIAFARTVLSSSYRDSASWSADLGMFAMTFLMVAGGAIAAVVAFVVTCTAITGPPRFQ